MSSKIRSIYFLAASVVLAAGCQGSEEGNGQQAGNAAAPTANNAAPAEVPDTTIAQSLAGSQDHSTLFNAVKAAGLEATMAGSQPYTVFAPTNAAFQKLEGSSALLAPEQKGQLTAVLTHHVVPGVVTAADLVRAIEKGGGKAQLATVGGGTLTVSRSGDTLTVADPKGGRARVSRADMLQSNGVVHSIDGVLQPG